MNFRRKDQHIKVFVRIKPTNNFATEVIELLPDQKSLTIHAIKEKRKGYINNQILDWNFRSSGVLHNCSQEDVYETCASSLVNSVLDGCNGTIFAYGQTGAGKTYTMTGSTENFEHRGIIPRAISQLFKGIEKRHEHDITVKVSYLEIYNETLIDLLLPLQSPSNSACDLSVTEATDCATYVKGLTRLVAQSEEEALSYLFEGELNRSYSQHALNKTSSRSHCIFTVFVESHSKTQSETTYTSSKLNLVDLAGSERLSKTLSENQTQKEAVYINKSLTFLEQTVKALANPSQKHIPYRQCKLTHVLKDALGGKCNTVMIGNIWGERGQIEETHSTMRFSSRVMNVVCQPAVNSLQDANRLCAQHQKEITVLLRELAMYDTLTNRSNIQYGPLSDIQITDVKQQVQKFMDESSSTIDVINFRQLQEVFGQFRELVMSMESRVEKQLRDKYTLIKKVEAVGDSTEPKVLPQELKGISQVGTLDGKGFSVGQPTAGVKPAAPSAVVNAKKKTKRKEHSESSATDNQPSNANPCDSVAAYGDEISHEPPTKEEAFETFKCEHGASLNTIFVENMKILKDVKKEAGEVTKSICELMTKMSVWKGDLAEFDERKSHLEVTLEGEVILKVEEKAIASNLSELEQAHREKYAHLQNLRSDIAHCEQVVAQCEAELLSEFEVWYKDSYEVADELDLRMTIEKQLISAENDFGAKFDRARFDWLRKCPESFAFYNARGQTDRRRMCRPSKN